MATTVIDWSMAQLTKAATNASPEKRLRVVQVSRQRFDEAWSLSWADVEERAESAQHGCEQWLIGPADVAPRGFAYLREGTGRDGSLLGHALLYSQDW